MTRPQILLDAIGEVQDDYLVELDDRIAAVKGRKKRKRAPLIAACLSLVLIMGIVGVWRFLTGGTGGRCNNAPVGIAAGGYFYYELQSDGIYRYAPDEGCVKLIQNGGWMNEWYSFTANDYGFYYTKGDRIYRVRHGETNSELLYRYEGKVSTPYMYPAGATDIAVDVFYEGKNVGYHSEIFIIDGITGERKTTIIDENKTQEELDRLYQDGGSVENDEAWDALFSRPPVFAETVTYTVGDRTLTLALLDGKDLFDYGYQITENGRLIYDGCVAPYDVRPIGDSLAFIIGRDGIVGTDASSYLIVRPDGTQQIVQLGALFDSTLGSAEYCFTCEQWYGAEGSKDMHAIRAVRYRDNEAFELKWNPPDEWINFMYADAEYLWMTYYDRIACYRIVYENGVPTRLSIFDDNICEK